MNLKQIQKKENKLAGRMEILFSGNDNIVPSRKEILDEVVKQTKAKPKLIIINSIKQEYGTHNFSFIADIYESEERRNKFHVIPKKIKKKLEEKRKEVEKEKTKEETKKKVKEKFPEEKKSS